MRIKVKNFLDTIESFLRSNATAVREWILPDRNITIAGTDDVDAVASDLTDHINDTDNPHDVNKADVGLGNADNTSDANKPISIAAQAALDLKADLVEGKVPSAQLPSYVDDVVEAANFAALPALGETGKIYVTLDNNLTYRWSGSAYVEISVSLALGETSATAYRGDRGKIAYDHTLLIADNPHNTTKSHIGLGNVDNTSDANKPVSSATQTALNLKVDESNKQQFMLVQSLKNLYNY